MGAMTDICDNGTDHDRDPDGCGWVSAKTRCLQCRAKGVTTMPACTAPDGLECSRCRRMTVSVLYYLGEDGCIVPRSMVGEYVSDEGPRAS